MTDERRQECLDLIQLRLGMTPAELVEVLWPVIDDVAARAWMRRPDVVVETNK